jgi:predicted DNA-binding transcriptional regulator YafY
MSVLPTSSRAAAESLLVMVPLVGPEPGTQHVLQQLREAAQAKRRVHISYRDAADIRSTRTLRPLSVFSWGKVWTLVAWCETRQAFRNFHVDRIEHLEILPDPVFDEAGKTLADFLRQAHDEDRA